MTSLVGRVVEQLMKHRSKLPGWVDRLMVSVARNPDGPLGKLAGRMLRGEDPPATSVPDAALRLYVAPTNYSGQGYLWARAVKLADPRVGARNMAVELPGGYGFKADSAVPIATVNSSDAWANAEFAAVSQFTHVLVEAERSMFGLRFGRQLRTEISELQRHGVSVAFIAHGTDIRDPRAHATRTTWSPYPGDPRTATLQSDAEANLQLLTEAQLPTFVSTPDLLDDVPWATWCPVIADIARFITDAPLVLTRGPARVPRIIHASSNAAQKGSDLLEPALASLIATGEVSFELVTGAAAADMPGIYAHADVVLDQFRLGSYGVAACEAMAAGRLVIGHVLPSVRERIREITGLELPILEATPDTLATVVRDVLAEPARFETLAASGPEYVQTVHDGTASARALLDGWMLR